MKGRLNKRMQPEEVMEILKQEGIELTPEQVQLILDFLDKFAKISLAIIAENAKNESNLYLKFSPHTIKG